MSLRVLASPPDHFPWLLERVQAAATPLLRAISAVDEAGTIRGMVGFDRWTENAAEMHVACETKGAVRALLRPAFSYLFEETGRRIALGTVSGNNAAALKFDRHLGFREVHRVKDGFADGVDVVFLEMRREECRWIG